MLKHFHFNLRSFVTVYCSIFLVACMSMLVFMYGGSPAFAQETVLYGAAHTSSNGPSTLFRIDPASGAATPIGPIGFNHCGGLDFDTAGTLFGTAQLNNRAGVLISIDRSTGQGAEIGPTTFPDGVFDISIRNSDGAIYTSFLIESEQNCVTLGTINKHTGAGTYVGSTQTCNPGNGIAFSPADTLFLAQTTFETREGYLYTLNQTTGVATQVCPLVFPANIEFPRINAMDFQPGTDILFASLTTAEGIGSPKYLCTVNTTTGEVTIVGETVNGLAALAFYPGVPNHVPASSTAGMFVLTGVVAILTGLLMLRRGRSDQYRQR
jgi:hypothetical protein